jgi:hypothetical protein
MLYPESLPREPLTRRENDESPEGMIPRGLFRTVAATASANNAAQLWLLPVPEATGKFMRRNKSW